MTESEACENPYKPTLYNVSIYLVNSKIHELKNISKFPITEKGFIHFYSEDGIRMYREDQVTYMEFIKIPSED